MNDINRVLNKCVRAGASMAEVYGINQQKLTITVRKGKVEAISKSTPGGMAIRFFSVDRVAFAHTTDLSDNAVDLAIAKLSSLSKKTSKQEYASLPEPHDITDDVDIFGPSFVDISTDDKINYLVDLENAALSYDPLIKQANGMTYIEKVSTVKLVNTNGVDLSLDRTAYTVKVNLSSAKGEEMFPGEGEFSARYFEDLPTPDKMVDIIAGKAVRLIGGTAVEPGEYEIIFTPGGMDSLFWGMMHAINGDNLLRGSSFLADKEGEKIADAKFSLVDDAVMKRGVNSRPFDDEGTPSQKTMIIEDGILRTGLLDYKTAVKYGRKSTGSALRYAYNNFPEIGNTNLYIAAGKDKVEDVIASCKKGLLVEHCQGWGVHGVNGTYSAGINGTLIRNGKRIKPVANVTLAASNDELFNGIGAVCDDLNFYGGFNAPSVMIKKMHVGS